MRIEDRDIATIRPYEHNPRINADAVDAVAASIREFGFRQPIVVDNRGVIIAGHTRHKAALKLGLKVVPVHVATDMTPEQVQAYRLADNRLAELSQWDYDLLPLELSELQGGEVDLTALGWDAKEIERMLAPTSGEELPEKAGGKEFDESVAEDVPTVTCPKCGNQFPL